MEIVDKNLDMIERTDYLKEVTVLGNRIKRLETILKKKGYNKLIFLKTIDPEGTIFWDFCTTKITFEDKSGFKKPVHELKVDLRQKLVKSFDDLVELILEDITKKS